MTGKSKGRELTSGGATHDDGDALFGSVIADETLCYEYTTNTIGLEGEYLSVRPHVIELKGNGDAKSRILAIRIRC